MVHAIFEGVPSTSMRPQNSSKALKNAATGLAVFALVGSATYLALSGGGAPGGSSPEVFSKTSGGTGSELVLGGGMPGPQVVAKPPAAKYSPSVGPRMTALLVPKGPAEGAPLVAAGMNPDEDKGRVVRLKPAGFKQWGAVAQGERIALPSADGEELYGTVNIVSSDPGWFRIGGTLDGDGGTFQLNSSSDEVHGGVYLPGLGIGYQIQMDGSDVVLVERRLSSLVCSPGIKRQLEAGGRDNSGVVARAPGTQVIPAINTRPGAKGVIYVDFAGGVINSTAWGMTSITALPSVLSGDSITQAMTRAAEDFAPFDITLTTMLSVYQDAPLGRRMRVVVTPTDTAGPGTGGVAKVDSWKRGGSDIVCWVFNQGVKSCADTIAHEVGHTLGLFHHGTRTGGKDYYSGHGGGLLVPTSWGPIMGTPFSVNLTQWSRGQYYDANNTGQDDLSIIAAGSNNFGYVAAFGARGVVRILPLNGSLFQTTGTLTSQADSNVYHFSTTGGKLTATVRPASAVGTGDFRLDLLDGNGAAVVVADPVDTLGASISQTLIAGVYRLRVVPTGTGAEPVGGYKTGYSSYGSLGGYSMTGMVEGANTLPAFLNSKLITGTEKVPLSIAFEVTDPTKTTVSVLAQKLPNGLAVTPGTLDGLPKLVLAGTPPEGSSGGEWSLTLLAKSGVGETRMEFNFVISQQSLSLSTALGGKVDTITTLPTSPWIGVEKMLASGTLGVVAQSGPVADKGTSLIRCNYTAPLAAPSVAGGGAASWSVMTFFWQSDTERGKDVVTCRVDGSVAKDMITGQPLVLSGQRGWVKQTVLLSGTGTRWIEFAYTKDANLRSGMDKVWVYGIEIGQPPMIKISPVSSLRVTPGPGVGSGSFSLSAVATGATSIAWWKNGVALVNGTSSSGSILSGVSTGTLSVTGPKAADAGVYWMVARNSWGAVASQRAEVVVWVPPVVTSQPVAPIGLQVGDPLILTAQVSGAQPMYYQWKKNGVAGRWVGTPSLMINRTTAASAGKYVLVAVNPSGTVSSQEVTVSFTQPAAKTAAAAK
jgi:hypothetical protein